VQVRGLLDDPVVALGIRPGTTTVALQLATRSSSALGATRPPTTSRMPSVATIEAGRSGRPRSSSWSSIAIG
jgi:hypothetical protein